MNNADYETALTCNSYGPWAWPCCNSDRRLHLEQTYFIMSALHLCKHSTVLLTSDFVHLHSRRMFTWIHKRILDVRYYEHHNTPAYMSFPGQKYFILESVQLRKHCISKAERHRARRSAFFGFFWFENIVFSDVSCTSAWQQLDTTWSCHAYQWTLNQ